MICDGEMSLVSIVRKPEASGAQMLIKKKKALSVEEVKLARS